MKVRRFVYSVASALALTALWSSFPLLRALVRRCDASLHPVVERRNPEELRRATRRRSF
jgi:hypothetical protein